MISYKCCLSIETMKTIGSSCVGGGGSSLPVCAQVAGEADLRTKVPAAVGAGDGARSLGPRGIFLPLLPSSLGRDDCCGLVLASTAMNKGSPFSSVCCFLLPCGWVDPKSFEGDFQSVLVPLFGGSK